MMLIRRSIFMVVALMFVAAGQTTAFAAPSNFTDAKIEGRKYVYFDRNENGDLYCGCNWTWVGQSGGRVDKSSCGYQTRKQEQRASRTEWEHIVPAWHFGHQRQCWQSGGRQNCEASDPAFGAMEADLHNLTPVVGEVNADRSNYQYAEIPGEATQYGACDAETDFKGRAFEPRPEARGLVARVNFYMADRYNLRLSSKQERLFMAWDKMYPVSVWEKERDRRIASRMGHHNPFVTGQAKWAPGHKNSSSGIYSPLPRKQAAEATPSASPAGGVRGNKNSMVYHLSVGCSSYEKVAPHNRVEFRSEQAAVDTGYRKAGNCR
ncbi:deoxyribonuclease I [gamma proteobacterium BDW918]|nr:deoxyribonuclease I [gamma proteobacterium BDW918]